MPSEWPQRTSTPPPLAGGIGDAVAHVGPFFLGAVCLDICPPPHPAGQLFSLPLGPRQVKLNAFHMNRALDKLNLQEALKHGAALLGELRTNLLSPQKYYELCVSPATPLPMVGAAMFSPGTALVWKPMCEPMGSFFSASPNVPDSDLEPPGTEGVFKDA